MRKEKREEMIVQYLNRNNELLLKCRLFSTPLREEAILRICLEFFDDPEPCMIHRSAAMNRMYMELLEYLQKFQIANINRCAFSELPERISSYIDIYGCHEIVIGISC